MRRGAVCYLELPRIPIFSTHSGDVTLGTWLLQYPTHRDHDPTEHRRDASALQIHFKDPESPILTSHHALRTLRAPSPYATLPALPPEHLCHQGPPTRPMRRPDLLPALLMLFPQ